MGWIRLYARLPVFVMFLTATAGLALVLMITELLTRRPANRPQWAQRCFRGANRCLGLDIRYHGQCLQTPALYVSNHISWCDIPAVGARVPLRFLAKSEVGHWPLIGWLARQGGTLFIQRGAGRARQTRADMARVLSGGESVLFFPEGTSTTGQTVMPFHGLLLQAAQKAGVPIQPVTISYCRNGQPDPVAPFVGDTSFLRHLAALLRQPPDQVEVSFHPPLFQPAGNTNRLAAQLHATILAGLQQHYGKDTTAPENPDFSTTDTPGLFPHPSPAAGQQFPGQNKV